MPTTTRTTENRRTQPDRPNTERSERPAPARPNAERLAAARESFSGRLLSDAQFKEAIAITGIIEREIHRSGTFKEKLSDYAYAFARTEKFDAAKAETIVRDLFKERVGFTMNQMREMLATREQSYGDNDRHTAYQHACAVGDRIEHGNKISFNRALSHEADKLARDLGITEVGAKKLMAEEFKAVEQTTDLYEWGKALEEQFYRPQIEAERQSREKPQETETRSPSRTVTRTRTGPSGP
ncbi:MAG: hypothetical protein J0L77_02850 [Alphaproteobacteria bacterium]|nr:hypothetical protein [Alphaproteobacteria bacterium]